MAKLKQLEDLPRLLDLDEPLPLHRRRWYWCYIHRWRMCLFQVWRRETSPDYNDPTVEQGVDDMLGVTLLAEYFRRTGHFDLPSLSSTCRNHSPFTIADVVATLAEGVEDPFLTAVLDPNEFSDARCVPISILQERWEKRLCDATWQAFGDRKLPLSFFGDFHQLCAGNPLRSISSDMSKRSTRQVHGMFYTPSPIVDYLVWTSLNRVLADRMPEELSQIRILDPSCGCGAFLIGCFRFLIHWHKQHVGDTDLATQYSIQAMEYMCRGCDIDSRALRWTAKLLLLAVWESIKGQSISGKAIFPDFRSILCCQSFLEPPAEHDLIWPKSEYDIILGGPPFVRTETLHQGKKDRLRYYHQRFLSARRGQFDLYMLFIEQALDMLKPGGIVAFSLSNSFLRSESGRYIRGYIAANASVEEIVEFDDPCVYDDASVQIVLLRLRKGKPRCAGRYVHVRGRGHIRHKLHHLLSDCPRSDIAVVPLNRKSVASSHWYIADYNDDCWLQAIRKGGVPLGSLLSIEYGLSTGMDDILLLKKVGVASAGIMLAHRRGEKRATRFEEAAFRSVIRGYQLKKYGSTDYPNVYPFPFDDHGRLLSEDAFKRTFPLTYSYLLRHQHVLSHRRLVKGCSWYSTFTRLPGRVPGGERLMSARIVSSNSFRLVNEPMLTAHCSVVVLTPVKNPVDLHYLLGILNSTVFARYVSLIMPRINVGRFSLRLAALRQFPIPAIKSDVAIAAHDRIASLVRRWLDLSAEQPMSAEWLDSIETEIARLYNVENSWPKGHG